jgi:hypothetical protein
MPLDKPTAKITMKYMIFEFLLFCGTHDAGPPVKRIVDMDLYEAFL